MIPKPGSYYRPQVYSRLISFTECSNTANYQKQ